MSKKDTGWEDLVWCLNFVGKLVLLKVESDGKVPSLQGSFGHPVYLGSLNVVVCPPSMVSLRFMVFVCSCVQLPTSSGMDSEIGPFRRETGADGEVGHTHTHTPTPSHTHPLTHILLLVLSLQIFYSGAYMLREGLSLVVATYSQYTHTHTLKHTHRLALFSHTTLCWRIQRVRQDGTSSTS